MQAFSEENDDLNPVLWHVLAPICVAVPLVEIVERFIGFVSFGGLPFLNMHWCSVLFVIPFFFSHEIIFCSIKCIIC